MTRRPGVAAGLAAFGAGAAVLAWVGLGYASTSPLALAMTLLITTAYALGGLELRRYHQATTGLQQRLAVLQADPPADASQLDGWLLQLHPTLQQPVRLRIAGERVGLPGPALVPYLVGLLVLLGMLGTFLGMVVTLKGAALALQTSTDLPTIRAALTAPVQGLGLAFGTSVAGVAASAMLGLVAALCRRVRLQAAQQLDGHIATTLRCFSRAAQQADRQTQQHGQLLQALQALHDQQAQAAAALLAPLHAAAARLGQDGQALGAQLQAGQQHFHQQALAAQTAQTTLVASVAQSLQRSLEDGARLAAATLAPAVQATLDGIGREAGLLQAQVADTVQQQLDGLAQRFDTAMGQVAGTWQAALADQQRSSLGLADTLHRRQAAWAQAVDAQSAALLAGIDTRQQLLLDGVHTRQQQLLDGLAARDADRLATLAQPLHSMAASLRSAFAQAGADAAAQQAQICRTLEATAERLHTRAAQQAQQTVAEVAQLLQAAGEAPRAAAAAMAQLRQQLADSLARDDALQDERAHTAATLASLLDAAQHAATGQRAAIDSLVAHAHTLQQQASTRQAALADATASQMASAASQVTDAASRVVDCASQVAAAAAQVAGGALDVASLGDAFGAAVVQFGDSNQALLGQLQRIEAALGQTLARSDDQLAYYVAQAREIIDLSLLSQKQIVDDLQRVAAIGAAAGPGAAAAEHA
ncbi:MAG: DUF802 domain-containing protein [Aquabacterium sp.]|nr:DUF802 domain-containing protein [Aquabacterium sp.]